jgi:hypothetical protein
MPSGKTKTEIRLSVEELRAAILEKYWSTGLPDNPKIRILGLEGYECFVDTITITGESTLFDDSEVKRGS